MHNFHLHDHSAISDGGQSPTPGFATLAAFASAVAGGTSAGHLLFDSRMPRQPEDVVVFMAAVTLCVFVGWFVANVVSWTVALRCGRTLRRFTLPGTRRLAQVLLALSLSTACITEADDSPTMVMIEGETTPTTEEPATLPSTSLLGSTQSTAAPTTAAPTTAAPTNVAPVATAPMTTAPMTAAPMTAAPVEEDASELDGVSELGSIPAHELIVNHGDNLWSLSVETLERYGAANPSVSTVASYWRLVVAANDVRSGNPNLIVAGEPIHMPGQRNVGSTPSPSQPAMAVR